MRHHRALRHPGLLRMYTKARATADRLRISGWHHHLRHHNKTADALANRAMDDQVTTTWRPRPGHQDCHADFPMTKHIANDLGPWIEAHSALLTHTQAGYAIGRQPEPA